ncbi:hypothetical protein [Ferrimonas pelagia]|uniref:DUF2845 domain-containing protein n=1 Tax=Ferrimonas pelagia TaxID=1177826 RepID=A0ABP9ETM8_9GAMM
MQRIGARLAQTLVTIMVLGLGGALLPACGTGPCGAEAEGQAGLIPTCSKAQPDTRVVAQGDGEYQEGYHYKRVSGINVNVDTPFIVEYIQGVRMSVY